LIEEGFNFSPKVADITDIMWFSLRDRLVKLSAILAAINNDGVIDEKAVMNAYKDMYQFWRSQCYFAEDYVMLTPSYVQRQMRIRTVIDVLVQHSATSVNPVDYELVASHLTKILQVSYGLAKYLLDELITQGILSVVNTDRGKMVYLRANDDEYNRILTRYYGVK
jgi:ribosomal protein S25